MMGVREAGFAFEEFPEGFNELESHVFEKTADVLVVLGLAFAICPRRTRGVMLRDAS